MFFNVDFSSWSTWY